MGLIDELGLELNEGITKDEILEQLFALRKKAILRQNASNTEKRTEAELLLETINSLDEIVENADDQFDDYNLLITTYAYAKDNNKLNEDLKKGLARAARCDKNETCLLTHFFRDNSDPEIYKGWLNCYKQLGGDEADIDQIDENEEKDRRDTFRRAFSFRFSSDNKPDNVFEGDLGEYEPLAQSDSNQDLEQKYEEARVDALLDYFDNIKGYPSSEWEFYDGDTLFVGFEPTKIDEENNNITFPIAIHVTRFFGDDSEVDYTESIPGEMLVGRWNEKDDHYCVINISFTRNGQRYQLFDRLTAIVGNHVRNAVADFLRDKGAGNIRTMLVPGKKVEFPANKISKLSLFIACDHLNTNGKLSNYYENDPIVAEVLAEGKGSYAELRSLTGKWHNETVISYNAEGQVQASAASGVDNALVLARRAVETGDLSGALHYYEKVLLRNPNDWEAYFGSILVKTLNCKNYEIKDAVSTFSNSIIKAFELIDLLDSSDQVDAINKVCNSAASLCEQMPEAAMNYYRSTYNTNNGLQKINELAHSKNECAGCMYIVGNQIESKYLHTYPELRGQMLRAWKMGVAIHQNTLINVDGQNKTIVLNSISEMTRKIQMYDPNFGSNNGGYGQTVNRTYTSSSTSLANNAKLTSIVGYLTFIGFLIAYLTGDKENAKVHLNNCVLLLIGSFISTILNSIEAFKLFGTLLSLAIFVYWWIGFIWACQDKQKELPFIGSIHILK